MLKLRTAIDFSPLLIGEFGVTGRIASLSGRSGAFQSPPHRGIRCDAVTEKGRGMAALRHFSPLLIGEFGVTHQIVVDTIQHSYISVPSSSGNSV